MVSFTPKTDVRPGIVSRYRLRRTTVVVVRPDSAVRRRLWRIIAGLVFGLIFVDRLVYSAGDTFERYAPDDYLEKVAACANRRPDFVVLGGSPVAEGIDPDLLTGIHRAGVPLGRGYALGLNGGTTTDFFHALGRACPEPPRLLIYGVSATDWNDARNEPHGPYSLMTVGDVVRCHSIRPDAAGWVTKHFLEGRLARATALFRYRNGIRLWAAEQVDAVWPGSCPESTRDARSTAAYTDALRSGTGYAPTPWFAGRRYDLVKAAGDPGPPFGFLDKYRTGSHLKYHDQILARARANGVAVVIVDMPVTADLEQRYPDVYAGHQSRIIEWEARGPEPVLRATREAVGLTDADFADIIHLNGVGAAKLSRWLRERLDEPNHLSPASPGRGGGN